MIYIKKRKIIMELSKIAKVLRMLVIIHCAFLGAISYSAEGNWVDLAVHNFGAPINTMWAQGELSFSGDGTMVYCSARQDMAVASGDPKDLYIATFNSDTGSWNTPINMGIPINAAPATSADPLRLGDDREPWITADGNTIYFKSDRTATTSPRNNNDLFITKKVNGEWTTPTLVGFPISTNVGDEHCPAILQDGKTLCFASKREGGFGGSDIYCSVQDVHGDWMIPVNQGLNINTAAEEFHFTQDKNGMAYFRLAAPAVLVGWIYGELCNKESMPGMRPTILGRR
ncbi:MAG: peptidoglycan-associated lipoprotein [Oceanospirillaceae bacterium]